MGGLSLLLNTHEAGAQFALVCTLHINKKASRAVAREPRDAAAVVFGLKFAYNIHTDSLQV